MKSGSGGAPEAHTVNVSAIPSHTLPRIKFSSAILSYWILTTTQEAASVVISLFFHFTGEEIKVQQGEVSF